jgi:C4-dicarboxylate-specific signal transduction histidine kinase
MGYPEKAKWSARPAVGYGLALVSVAAAAGLTQVFLYFHLPLAFNAFALSAIAITFWYSGTKPGILAAVLSAFVRSYVFDPEINSMARVLFDLVFMVFALLMTRVTRARDELEVRVAERTVELTRASEDLKLEIIERKRAEAELRASEAYLAEAQRLSHTGSWASRPATGEITYLSEECYRVLAFDPHGGQPRYETFFQRIHPDDQAKLRVTVEAAGREKVEFELDYRIIHPGGEIRDIHVIGHPVLNPSGDLVEFVGTVIDVTELKLAEEHRERLREARADLVRINRVTAMGELTASLAHEVNQPIAAAITDANTCLRWLMRDPPDLGEAREAASRTTRDATRAAEIISRVRQLFKKGTPQRELVHINEVIQEMVVLLRSEAARYSISVRTDLAADLPHVTGDRVQLQQVLMNLIMNSIDAMRDVDGTRELIICSQQAEDGHLMISVSDTGVGLPPQQADRIFNAFFSTKPQGTGMGLRISRSIVESHGGRLWAADNSSRGASFHLTLPTKIEAHD